LQEENLDPNELT